MHKHKHKNVKTTILAGTLAAALLAGCASLPPGMTGQYPNSADVYTPGQAQQVQQVRLGVVLSVRSVQIAATGTQTGTGSAVGALVGGLLGHSVGGGRGKTLATVAGAIGGGIGGNLVAQHAYTQPGLAITVKLDDGRLIDVTQAADVQIVPGERVQLISAFYGEPARVLPLPQQPQAVAPSGTTVH